MREERRTEGHDSGVSLLSLYISNVVRLLKDLTI
jgi:hypothetical protein